MFQKIKILWSQSSVFKPHVAEVKGIRKMFMAPLDSDWCSDVFTLEVRDEGGALMSLEAVVWSPLLHLCSTAFGILFLN